jgi:hypothetical protein
MAMAMTNWLRWSRRPETVADTAPASPLVQMNGFVDKLSEKLYRQMLGEGGWAVDIGVYGPNLFRQDARRVVQEIALSGTVSGPPTP